MIREKKSIAKILLSIFLLHNYYILYFKKLYLSLILFELFSVNYEYYKSKRKIRKICISAKKRENYIHLIHE